MNNFSQWHNFLKFFLFLLLIIFTEPKDAVSSTNKTMHHVRSFNKSDYEGANKNWSVTFDEKGYTYFGNDIGLVEFDGVSWNLYPSHNGLMIRCVKSFRNRVYSGGYRELGYWERNETGSLTYTSLTGQIEEHLSKNEEFWDIAVLDDKIYFRSFTGVYIYAPDDGFEVLNVYGFISHSCVVDNNYLMSINDKGIFKIEENKILPVLESGFFRKNNIVFIKKTKETGVYLLATESHGIFRYYTETGATKPWAAEHTGFFMRNKIDKAIRSPKGDMILGTIMNGVMILDKEGNLRHHINVDSGLQSNTVHALASDKTGNIWVVSDKGIDFVSFPSPQSYVSFNHDEMGAVYSAALFEDYVYMGTNQGLFRRPWKTLNQLFTLVPGTERQVWDCRVVDDKLFVGHNSGTFLIDKNHHIKRISSRAGASSLTRVPSNYDHLIQSTFNQLVLYKKENQHWNAVTTVAGFDDLINSVAFDHLGNLWASHPYRGIYRIRLNDRLDSVIQLNYHGQNTHFWQKGNSIRVFKVDNRIVLTNGEQIHTYDDLNDSIIPYDFLNEKLGEYSSSYLIVRGKSNHYWFMNKKGIALFNIYGGSLEKVKEFPITLFESDLIPRRENLTPVTEKSAILCLENGYAILDASTKDAGEWITEENLTLRKAYSSNDSGETRIISPDAEKITTSFANNNLSLVYSFPMYSSEELKYQYILEGLMQEWSEPIETPSFTISRIPPGKYLIKVRAVNNWQRYSDVHETMLTVIPPFYQSGIAFIIYALFVFSLYIFVRYIIRRKVRMQEKHKWEEKEQEMIRLRNKKLQADLSFKSREIATTALSMAKKNESLLEIKRKLSSQKEKLGTRYPDRYFNEIIRKIDEGVTGDDEWKVFEHNFNQAHETFLHNLKDEYPDLTPNDLRLCAFLRINLASKEIASLLGISVRGVENHRYRLRKKLNLSAEEDLAEFIFTFQGKVEDKSGQHTINDDK